MRISDWSSDVCSSDLWELEVWTGGSDVRGARVTAAMLAGSGDLAEVPLLLRPGGAEPTGQHAWSPTVVIGADAVPTLVRPPLRELPGVRVTPLPGFDQKVEEKMQLKLYTVLDGSRYPAAPFGVQRDSVTIDCFVSDRTMAL